MARSRWEAFLRELRKLVFGACCALGGLAGVWSAMAGVPQLEPGSSLGDELLTTLQPMLARFGIGLAAGTAAGLVLVLTLLRPRRPR
jgi:hypothetical protein